MTEQEMRDKLMQLLRDFAMSGDLEKIKEAEKLRDQLDALQTP